MKKTMIQRWWRSDDGIRGKHGAMKRNKWTRSINWVWQRRKELVEIICIFRGKISWVFKPKARRLTESQVPGAAEIISSDSCLLQPCLVNWPRSLTWLLAEPRLHYNPDSWNSGQDHGHCGTNTTSFRNTNTATACSHMDKSKGNGFAVLFIGRFLRP